MTLFLICTSVISVMIGILLLVMGYKFRKGKWLRLIAGNMFNDAPDDKEKEIGKVLGILLYV